MSSEQGPLNQRKFQAASIKLLKWFELNRRDLPWRIDPTPYTVWISEIMLQQTVINTVIPHFTEWVDVFPDLQVLARSDEQTVLRQWEGLGYYNRARNILESARIVIDHHGGVLPQSYQALAGLPGIGDYTASAILSIGYGLPYPAVDANVRRIAARIHAQKVWSRKEDNSLKASLASIIPVGRPGEFNEALMELGQTICIPRHPLCHRCPLSSICRAFQIGVQEEIPARRGKRITEKDTLILILLRDSKTWITKSTAGLLKGLWVFPGILTHGVPPHENSIDKRPRLPHGWAHHLTPVQRLSSRTHTYTRYRDRLHPHTFKLNAESSLESISQLLGRGQWVGLSELDSYPMPTVYRRISRELIESNKPTEEKE